MKKSVTQNPTKNKPENAPPYSELLYQALETELGGVEIYTTAIECAMNEDLRAEWRKYLKQTKHHVLVVRQICASLGLDPERDTPGRKVVRHIGTSLVQAMQLAKGSGTANEAEIVAAECVTLAETKDHANWELIGKLAENGDGKLKSALQSAYEEIESEEDEHLYHSSGWARELWLEKLGLPARLPPPEEEEDVHSAEEAARAKKS